MNRILPGIPPALLFVSAFNWLVQLGMLYMMDGWQENISGLHAKPYGYSLIFLWSALSCITLYLCAKYLLGCLHVHKKPTGLLVAFMFLSSISPYSPGKTSWGNDVHVLSSMLSVLFFFFYWLWLYMQPDMLTKRKSILPVLVGMLVCFGLVGLQGSVTGSSELLFAGLVPSLCLYCGWKRKKLDVT